ncbi:uncharacterized protein Z520_10682 [Fonsecaea multimorphosa CBS 102226]|uniref:Uncharacterized protein n=1 Tax=Fonsecaea multimorphosa CBS 102226 TaxID=1442371 RepID=A0A0D2JSR4_9EURO|nr:uncharacterized protein Z520_10682 [Fonsecaea multimorphosa CBS 102226]KIX93504.1 hypothetical protein Z520_10682 [Fonsecaea multimorphosa CBS 102226]OAL18820.1 hypothetical protein AYO22_10149 [Fonsecaea multimorphosa]
MPQYSTFSIPKEGISREVVETDLPFYLGRDAKVMENNKGDRYVIQSFSEPPRHMITSLRDDTARWQRSDDHRRRLRYSESRIHQDRKRACHGKAEAQPQLTRHNSRDVTSGNAATGVSPIPVPSRPPLAPRYSSSNGSVYGSMQVSPSSAFESASRSQSRRESDAMSSLDGGMISRTMSASSTSSSYGTNGGYGFNRDLPGGQNGECKARRYPKS